MYITATSELQPAIRSIIILRLKFFLLRHSNSLWS